MNAPKNLSKKVKRVCVIGSNSFTGSHFIKYLLDNTNAEILTISRSLQSNQVFLPYSLKILSSHRFSFHRIDLNNEFDNFTELCSEFKPQVVVNFAAQGEVRNSWNWPTQWYKTNCIATVKIAEFLKDKKYLFRYVTASTPEVYGTTGKNISENTDFKPSTPYAVSKLAGDLHLGALHKRHGFPVVFTRAANLYGIHQQLYRIIPRTIIYLKLNKIIELHGKGLSQRAFIHGRDIAEGTWKAVTNGTNGQVYHLSPHDGLISIKDLVKMICREMNYDFEKATHPIDENFGQDAIFSLDSSKAKSELGWSAKVNLLDGIQETIEWIENNWGFIREQSFVYSHKE